MLILELFKDEYPEINSPEDITKNLDIDPDYEPEQGKYAGVYRSKSNPNVVYKIGRVDGITPKHDAYLSYVKKIKNLKIPVFPQIYDVQIFKIKEPKRSFGFGRGSFNTNYMYVVTMEKLLPFQPSKQEMEHLLSRFFGDDAKSYSVNPMDFGYELERLAGRKDYESIHDAYGKELVLVLNKLFRRFSGDIHSNNIMMRRTPYGIQPVITDPVN
jgi:hypothetical protein